MAAENGFLEKDMRFNIQYDLAEYMIHRSEEDGNVELARFMMER